MEHLVVKVVLLGDSGVGKSSLLTRFVDQRFSGAYKATIGADFVTHDIVVDGRDVTLQVWDTAGQERFQSLGTAFFRGADCCVLVFDVNVLGSFSNLGRWQQEFITQAAPSMAERFPFIVLGNKTDKDERVISTKDATAWCDSHGMRYFETRSQPSLAFGTGNALGCNSSLLPSALFPSSLCSLHSPVPRKEQE